MPHARRYLRNIVLSCVQKRTSEDWKCGDINIALGRVNDKKVQVGREKGTGDGDCDTYTGGDLCCSSQGFATSRRLHT